MDVSTRYYRKELYEDMPGELRQLGVVPHRPQLVTVVQAPQSAQQEQPGQEKPLADTFQCEGCGVSSSKLCLSCGWFTPHGTYVPEHYLCNDPEWDMEPYFKPTVRVQITYSGTYQISPGHKTLGLTSCDGLFGHIIAPGHVFDHKYGPLPAISWIVELEEEYVGKRAWKVRLPESELQMTLAYGGGFTRFPPFMKVSAKKRYHGDVWPYSCGLGA